jgi:hypothetical protein
MVMGINGHNSENLARTQANTAINHPDETVTEGGRAQGQASKRARGIATDYGESRDPIDDRLRTRSVCDATPLRKEPEHTSNSTKADPYLQKKPQSQPHQIDLVVHDKPVGLGFVSPQTLLSLLVGLLGAVSLVFDPCKLFAQIAIVLCPLRGFTFPLLAAVSEFGLLAHHAPSCHTPSSQAMGD